MMDGFEEHVVDRESRGALPLTETVEFWLAVVSIFNALYETSGTNVHSKDDIAKHTLSDAYRCVNYFKNEFLDTEQFSPQSLVDEGDKGAHDLCGAIRRKMD